MRRSKSYEVRDPMNIWNKYDFAMSGLGADYSHSVCKISGSASEFKEAMLNGKDRN